MAARAKKQGTGNPATNPKATPAKGETGKVPVKVAKTKYVAKTAGPKSTESPRLKAIHARLDKHIRKRFKGVEGVFDYGMHGWKAPRLRKVEWNVGTMDPNWFFAGIAERASGITLHVWAPVEFGGLAAHKAELTAAGFKVMVGCLQFNRKSEYPIEAVEKLFGDIAAKMRAEA